MMDRDQWILSKIAEEAAEIAQRAMKAQQFGFDEIQAGQSKNNLERLMDEIWDLNATVSLTLGKEMYRPTPEHTKLRRKRMNQFLELSQKQRRVVK